MMNIVGMLRHLNGLGSVVAYAVNKLKTAQFLRQSPMFLIKVAISTALIIYLFSSQVSNYNKIWASLTSANVTLVLLALSLHGVGLLLSAWRWQLLLKSQDASVPVVTLTNSYLVGIFFSSFLPGTMGGDVVRANDTSRPAKSLTKALLIVFVDRLTGMVALLFLVLLALPMLNWSLIERTNLLWIVLAFSVTTMFAMMFLFSYRLQNLMKYFSTHLLRLPVANKLTKKAETFYQAMDIFKGKKQVIILSVFIAIILQVNVVVHYFLIGEALTVHIPLYYYFAIIPVALLILMLPASINGIGLREGIFIYFFGHFGISAEVAVSFAWIAFSMVILQAIIGGIVFAFRRS